MKVDPKIIDTLNSLLSEELTAVNQYMVHAEMAENWGYSRLDKRIQKRAIVEMKHAEKLIGRILFLEGRPIVSNLMPMKIGADVPQMFQNDHGLELDAVRRYNDAITLCRDLKDRATADLLQEILNDEDDHVDEIEEGLDQIEQMGLQMFLSTQTEGK